MKQVDSNLNNWQGALDAYNGQTLTDAGPFTSSLASLNASTVADIVGKATMMVHVNVTVTFNAATTVIIQGTVDGTNFFQLPFFVVQSNAAALAAEQMHNTIPGSTASGTQLLLCVSTTGFKQLRVLMNAFTTAGTAVVAIRATLADYRIYAQPTPSLLTASLGLVATGATTLFVAPGAGLFNYLTSIHISVGATAAVAAGATSTTITLVSPALVYEVTAAIQAIGVVVPIVSIAFPNPVKGTVNTATTANLAAFAAGFRYRVVATGYVGA